MILVVGHGPSSQVDPRWVDDQEFVVRCDTPTHKQNWEYLEEGGRKVKVTEFRPHTKVADGVNFFGIRVDAVVTTQINVRYTNAELWCEADYRDEVRALSNRFVKPNRQKLSTGTVACCIAKLIKFPDKEIGVIGFDTTLREYRIDETGFWPYHDARGEGELLKYLGIKDYGNYV